MMAKKEKFLFLKVFLVAVLVFVGSFVGAVFYSGSEEVFNNVMMGFSVKDFVSDSYGSLSLSSKLFLGGEVLLILLILILVFYRDSGVLKRKRELKKMDLSRYSKGTHTDLDVLYNILKDKKKISLYSVEGIFNVSEDVAMDWAQTLESAKLAVLDYPMVGGAVLKIAEKNPEDKSSVEKKEKVKETKKADKKSVRGLSEKKKNKK